MVIQVISDFSSSMQDVRTSGVRSIKCQGKRIFKLEFPRKLSIKYDGKIRAASAIQRLKKLTSHSVSLK